MIFSLVIALIVAGATWIAGWWAAAVVALVAGYVYRAEGGRPWRVALGATEGWALLLAVDAFAGPLVHVASTLSGAMVLPAPALVLVTLLFPALLGWSGAIVAAELSTLGDRRTASGERRPVTGE